MDTMKLLLGATVAVLFGALCWSFVDMKHKEKEASPDELSRLKKQIDEFRVEQERIQFEKQLQQVRSAAPVQTAPAASDAELEAMKAELAEKEADLKKLADEKSKVERDASTYRDEAGLVGQRALESSDTSLRRGRLIHDALLIARVREYAEDPAVGSFVTLEIIMPENVQVGTILAIRRNNGILGQLKVSDVTPEGAIANLLPGFGQVKPQAGDELILPPQI
ncbi:MAG: hypothetical protein QM680_05660 [Luteolibacter sp.]